MCAIHIKRELRDVNTTLLNADQAMALTQDIPFTFEA